MLDYVFLSLVCIISTGVIKRFNLIGSINLIVDITLKIKKVIFSKTIGDNWKAIILPAYALKIMHHSSKIIAIFLFIITLILIIDAMSDGFFFFLLSLNGIIASVIISTAYIFAWKLTLK